MRSFHAGFEPGLPPVKVSFGRAARFQLREVMQAMRLQRALIVTTPEQATQADEIASLLGALACGTFPHAAMHTPVELSDDAAAFALGRGADCVVAIGGGSTIGLAKAITLRTGLPQIAIPTTYAGSEATPVLGQTSAGTKHTLRDVKVQPVAVIYDPELVATLPTALTIASGLNAMAHAFEALYARDATPLSDQLALGGIQAFVDGLPGVLANPGDLAVREQTLFGSWLCGTVLAQVGMALHHKLCHTLGGSLNLPHAQTHAILLPHTVACNETVAGAALRPAARLLGAGSAGAGLFEFARRLGAPQALKDLGVRRDQLAAVADLAVENPYWNPRPVTRPEILALLSDAWEGRMPTRWEEQG